MRPNRENSFVRMGVAVAGSGGDRGSDREREQREGLRREFGSPRKLAATHGYNRDTSTLCLIIAELREASLKLPMRYQAMVLLMVVAAQYYVHISSMVLATFSCR